MDAREKLVELIRCADYHPCCGSVRKIGSMFTTEFIEDIASQLIANGVTVQEWVSVKDRLPEMSPDKLAEGYVQMQVLVWCDKGRQCAWFQVDTKTFYDQPGLFGTEVDGVTHWMTLPQPPKGEYSHEM